MRCLVCEEELEPQRGQPEWPWGAVVVRMRGMYGSTVYDPPISRADTEYLESFICDLCLVAKGKSGLIRQVRRFEEQPRFDRQPWRPEAVTD